MASASTATKAVPSPTAYLTHGAEGFERNPALTTRTSRDKELLDAMVEHVRSPLSELVVDGYGPKQPSNNLLIRHLEFFDRDQNGLISARENYEGWRAVGLSPLKSAIQTVGSAVIFGGGLATIRPAHLGAAVRAVYAAIAHDSMPALPTLDLSIEATMSNRPRHPSGVLNREGQLDEARFRELITSFLNYSRRVRSDDQPPDTMTKKQFFAFLGTEAVKGLGKKQFKTMVEVMENCGGDGLVRPIHLAAIYSGALMYNAQAVLDRAQAR